MYRFGFSQPQHPFIIIPQHQGLNVGGGTFFMNNGLNNALPMSIGMSPGSFPVPVIINGQHFGYLNSQQYIPFLLQNVDRGNPFRSPQSSLPDEFQPVISPARRSRTATPATINRPTQRDSSEYQDFVSMIFENINGLDEMPAGGRIDSNNSQNIGHNTFDNEDRRGLQIKQINLLPTFKIESETLLNNLDDKQCSICLEEYKLNDELKTLACCHKFHKSCIDTWLPNNRRCPVCKRDSLKK